MSKRESKSSGLSLKWVAVVVLIMVFATSAPATKHIPGDTSIGTWDPVNRVYNMNVDVYETAGHAIEIDEDNLTLDGAGHTITGPGIWLGYGVYLNARKGVTVKNVNVQKFSYGIYLNYSNYNTLTDNTTNSNVGSGILLWDSSNNTLTDNTANLNNERGISIWYSSNNILTDNVNSNNACGIIFGYCSNHKLTNNTTSNNGQGIQLYWSSGNTLTDNTCHLNSYEGFWLLYSDNNILTGNNVNSNNPSGVYLFRSSDNTLTGNTISWNSTYGIRLRLNSNGNLIYNNNFIGNSTQAYVYSSTDNVFNLPAPDGGNYWSNHTTPDDNGDGFVDVPYGFTGGTDLLPWVSKNGWALTPQEAIEQLIDQVAGLNLQQGIDNSLDAKLDAAFKALEDINQNNDVAAINALQAFINAVEAQRGNKISDADAEALIAAAQEIIDMLMAE